MSSKKISTNNRVDRNIITIFRKTKDYNRNGKIVQQYSFYLHVMKHTHCKHIRGGKTWRGKISNILETSINLQHF